VFAFLQSEVLTGSARTWRYRAWVNAQQPCSQRHEPGAGLFFCVDGGLALTLRPAHLTHGGAGVLKVLDFEAAVTLRHVHIHHVGPG